MLQGSLRTSILIIAILAHSLRLSSSQLLPTAPNCPLVCPAGWVSLPDAVGSRHCYLFPSVPIRADSMWAWQSYCASLYPSSNVIVITNEIEYKMVTVYILQYVKPYMDGAFYIWEGAYYQNGAWKTVTGETFYSGTNLQVGPLNPPTNGTCIYWNPKDLNTNAFWSYRPCTETYGTTACEMPPYADCTATITTPGPACSTRRMADFAEQRQRGYLAQEDLLTLEGMDPVSCGVACMYYGGCFSFDISDSGECRLLGDNMVFNCGGGFQADDTYRHYDLIAFPS